LNISSILSLNDTYDFIEKIGKLKIPSNALLFTIDIDSLYTNIETTVGLEAIQKFTKKFPNSNRPDKYILKLLEINLTKNDFEFDFYFSQLQSAAKKPFAFYRILDDIWSHSLEDFTNFAEHLNAHQASIKYKFTVHQSEVNFLDFFISCVKQGA